MPSRKSVRRERRWPRPLWLEPLAPLPFDAGTNPVSVALADVNGDGLLDLAVADHGDYYGRGSGVSGVALSALMRLPAERRAELHAEGLKRIARSGENDFRRFLLAECLEAYADLDEAQRVRLQA
jgi:hypothetical protein